MSSDYRMDPITRFELGFMFVFEIAWIAVMALLFMIGTLNVASVLAYSFPVGVLVMIVSAHIVLYRDYQMRRKADARADPLAHLEYQKRSQNVQYRQGDTRQHGPQL